MGKAGRPVEPSESFGHSLDPAVGAPGISALKLVDVRKRYGNLQVIDGLHLDVAQGSIFSLLGPNGAGKSTTMRMLVGQTRSDSGSISVLGHPVPARAREARSLMGVVPQADNSDEEITVRECLQGFAALQRVPRRERNAAVDRALELARLTSRADSRTDRLSGGMKRRLLIARALVHRPRLVLLDEPTVGLDPQIRQEIWQILAELRAEGSTMVMTTHYIEEAERLADRVAVMAAGRIVAEGTPRELVDRYAGSDVREFHGLPPEEDALVRRLADEAGLPVRNVGHTLAVLRGELLLKDRAALPFASTWRQPNLEDVFVTLTGEEAPVG